jgi:hypothetical protein
MRMKQSTPQGSISIEAVVSPDRDGLKTLKLTLGGACKLAAARPPEMKLMLETQT